jgi:hypothetical protein
MRITAKNVLAVKKKAVTFTAQLLHVMTNNIGPRFKQVSANWTATGSEAVVLDQENQMEYVITVTPRRRPENVTLQ